MTSRVFSYGGGWQSNAALVLAAQGQLDYQTFLFCNVGDDSEDPATLAYVRDYAMPYAATHGLDLIELRKIRRDGTPDTLLQTLNRSKRSLPIPVRMANGAPGNRNCTPEFKIKVVARWTRDHGATPADPATVAIGFTVDEIHRVGGSPDVPGVVRDYPLLDLGLRRKDIPAILRDAGLPMPPKSACWFCPMHREETWQTMRQERPELFGRAVALEAMLNERRDTLGKDHVYLTRFGRPLADVIPAGKDALFASDPGDCDSGWCFM